MSSSGIKFKNKNNEYVYPCPFYPIGSIYKSVNNNEPSTYFGGTWELVEKIVVDTGWKSFSWTNTSYIGVSSQSSYTQNKWRVKENILYIHIGVGAAKNIDTVTETEIARIPIKNNTSFNTSKTRIWNGAVGGSGTFGGFIVFQDDNYISISMKPHTSSKGSVAPWFSSYFAIPMDNNFLFTTGSYLTEYKYRRIS